MAARNPTDEGLRDRWRRDHGGPSVSLTTNYSMDGKGAVSSVQHPGLVAPLLYGMRTFPWVALLVDWPNLWQKTSTGSFTLQSKPA